MTQKAQPNYTFALTIVIIVCFLIGFVTTMNNSMIEFCKNAFQLNNFQSQLVNTAFYGAYIMSIPFGFMMSKIGYKATLVLGLAVVGLGFVINFLCINSNLDGNVSTIYWMFLSCMFVVALGIVMLQLVANPYVMVLGAPEKGAFRMTLSQALNSVATTVAPWFIVTVILNGKKAENAVPDDIPYPYLGLGLFTLLLCVILYFLKLPSINEGEQAAEASGAEQHAGVCLSGSCEYVWLAVKTSFLKSALLSGSDLYFSSLEKNRLKIRNQIGNNPQIAALIEHIIDDHIKRPPYYELEIKASLLRLFRLLLIGYTAEITPHESEIPPSLQPVLAYIDTHFHEEISSAQLAKMGSFSAPYFCRIFKETTGYSPIEYTNRLRIRKAYELISSTSESFSSIAQAVGFSNFGYFSKLFFKYTGKRLSQVRK